MRGDMKIGAAGSGEEGQGLRRAGGGSYNLQLRGWGPSWVGERE